MAKGYSARGGFSGGGSAMRQQQMQQKLLKMQQDMAAAQEAVENASFTASVGGGVVQATVSGKKELTALTVKPEGRGPGGCGDAAGSGDLCGERGPAPGGRGHEQLHAELHRRSESSWLRTVIPGRKRKGWNRHTIKEAAGRHAVRRVCPLLLPWKTHLLGVFVIANTVFGVSIASVLFGTFCYRQCAFRHILLSPAHLFGTICHGRYVFPVLLVIVNMAFRCCL